MTTRSSPQAFQVIPLVVWRVYVDGRPDELVRGVSIVGTPLAAMKRILATGDKSEVFNGECGAESGTVPVSAVAPAMLLSEMETQRQPQGTARPPILPIPRSGQGIGKRDSEQVATEQWRRNEGDSFDCAICCCWVACGLRVCAAPCDRAADARRCGERSGAEGDARLSSTAA